MKATKLAMIGLVAALLATPPATAAKNAKADLASLPAVLKQGKVALDQQDFDAAVRSFAKVAKIKGDSGTYFLLGYSHYQRGFQAGTPEDADKDDALETVNAYSMAIAMDPDLKGVSQPHRLYHSLAMSYEALKAYEKALTAYKMAFQAAPDNPMLPLYAARLRYRMGDVPKSAANLALSLRKAKAIGKEELIIKTIKGDALFAVLLGAPENQALVRDVENGREPVVQNIVAQAQAPAGKDLGELRDAIRDTGPSLGRQLAALPPQNPAVTESLAAADDSFKFRRYRAAVDGYNDVLRLDSPASSLNPVQRSILYERMGISYNKLGLTSEAIRSLQRSLQQMPNNASAHYQLAAAYSLSGKFTEALHALGETLKAAPSSGELRKYLLLAKTDAELEPLRDMDGFQGMIGRYQDQLARR